MEAGLASGEIGGVAGADLGCTALVARLSEASEPLAGVEGIQAPWRQQQDIGNLEYEGRSSMIFGRRVLMRHASIL